MSPDLAGAARAALPDRPWERFAPDAPLRPPRPAPLAVAAEPSEPEPAVPRVWRIVGILPIVMLTLFGVAVVIGSTPWVSERPTLGPPPTQTERSPAP